MLKLRENNGKINTIIVLIIIVAILAIVFAIKIFMPKDEKPTSNINYNEYSYNEEYSSLISQLEQNKNVEPIAQTSAKIASIVVSIINIVIVLSSIVLAIGTSKLYGKLDMPSWTVKYTIIWPIINIINGFIPDPLNTIISLVGGVLGIITLGYFFKSVEMKVWWVVLPFISLIALQFGVVGVLFGGILSVLAVAGLIGMFAFICAYIIANVKLGQIFNKSAGFIVGLAILPFIFQPILGFQKDN